MGQVAPPKRTQEFKDAHEQENEDITKKGCGPAGRLAGALGPSLLAPPAPTHRRLMPPLLGRFDSLPRILNLTGPPSGTSQSRLRSQLHFQAGVELLRQVKSSARQRGPRPQSSQVSPECDCLQPGHRAALPLSRTRQRKVTMVHYRKRAAMPHFVKNNSKKKERK